MKNAVSVNNNNSHKLLQKVKSLEAKRDQNLHSLKIEKDEVISSTWSAINKNKKETNFVADKRDVDNSFLQPQQETGSGKKKSVAKTSSLPPLDKQLFVSKQEGTPRDYLDDNMIIMAKTSPPGYRRISRLSSDKQHKTISPPTSPKIQTRNAFSENQHSSHFKSGRVPLSASAQDFVERISKGPAESSSRTLTKQRNLQTPQKLSDECHFDLGYQTRTAPEKSECQQSSHSPKLNRPKTACHSTFTQQRSLPAKTIPHEISTSLPDSKTMTAWNNRTDARLSPPVHRGLGLRPLYSHKDKEQTKQKNSDTVFARLYKGAKQGNRKYRVGEVLDKLGQGVSTESRATRRSAPRLEQRRRSVSLPDLSEILDDLKSCRYLRKDDSDNRLTELT